ncbi:hypothetical protein [Nocardia rhizosphaerihabitans]|nr:hypothetical protein [Nocardia rhizosphaerihabitans]
MRRAGFVRGGVLAGLICAMLSVAGVAAAEDDIPVDHALFVVPPVVDPVLRIDTPAQFDAQITADPYSEHAAPVQEPSLSPPPLDPILPLVDLGPMMDRIGLNPSVPVLPTPDRRLVDEALGVIAPSVQQMLPGDLGAGVLAGLTGLATMFGPSTAPVDSPNASPPAPLLDAGQQFGFASIATALPVVESVDLAIPTVDGPAAEVSVAAPMSAEPAVGPVLSLPLIILGAVIAGLSLLIIRRRRSGFLRGRARRATGRRTRGREVGGCPEATDPAAGHRLAVGSAAGHRPAVGSAVDHRPVGWAAGHRPAVGSAAGHRLAVGPAADHRPAVGPAAKHHPAIGSDAGRWRAVHRCSRLRPGLLWTGPERRPGRGGVAVRGDPWPLVVHGRCGVGRSPPSIRHTSRSEGVESTAAVEPAAVVSTTLGAAPPL